MESDSQVSKQQLEFIQSGKYSDVHYDRARKVFIKTFSPKAFDRFRYITGIRPAPGINFVKVAKRLKQLGIQVPEVLVAKPYYLEMRDVEGPRLRELLPDNPQLQQKYVDLIVTLYRNHVYCRGLHTKNFLVKDGELVAIDLDAYKLPRLVNYSGSDFLDKLKRSLNGPVPEQYLYDRVVAALGVSNAP
ncbi:hypothetical protein LMG33810_000125 [Carnimonas sp. LMG 33810]|uniref:hypothetical protein n=1 Tax=Carnimonas bestiolae TaxID=3402172 RepID=UPI003EDC1318